jgi:hypothetical protein
MERRSSAMSDPSFGIQWMVREYADANSGARIALR